MTALDRDLAETLVCPACRAALREEGGELACTGCELVYPVQGRVPVLLVEKARHADRP